MAMLLIQRIGSLATAFYLGQWNFTDRRQSGHILTAGF